MRLRDLLISHLASSYSATFFLTTCSLPVVQLELLRPSLMDSARSGKRVCRPWYWQRTRLPCAPRRRSNVMAPIGGHDADGSTAMRRHSIYGVGVVRARGRHAVNDTREALPVSIKLYINTFRAGTEKNLLEPCRFPCMANGGHGYQVYHVHGFPRLTKLVGWASHWGPCGGHGMLGSEAVGGHVDMRYVSSIELYEYQSRTTAHIEGMVKLDSPLSPNASLGNCVLRWAYDPLW